MGEKVVKTSEKIPRFISTLIIIIKKNQVVSRLEYALWVSCGPIGGMCRRVWLMARDSTVGLGMPHLTHGECLSFRIGVPQTKMFRMPRTGSLG